MGLFSHNKQGDPLPSKRPCFIARHPLTQPCYLISSRLEKRLGRLHHPSPNPAVGAPVNACLQSYHRFMAEHLFDHVDLPPGAVHIPDGTVPLADVAR